MDEDFESIYAETRHEAYANWRQSVFDNMEAARKMSLPTTELGLTRDFHPLDNAHAEHHRKSPTPRMAVWDFIIFSMLANFYSSVMA